jgi:microcystin-dependent protein
MAIDAHKNFAYSTVATAPVTALAGTSLVVAAAAGANFPAAPFNATVWPAGAQPTVSNAEIVRVTAVATDTFTITRQTESSANRAIVVGDQIAAGITVKALTDVEAAINPTGVITPYAGRTAPSNWLSCDGAAVSRATFAALFAVISPTLAGNPTITNATPAVVTLTAHGLITGDQIYLTTTGGLPTGLSINTIYFVIKIDANTFNLSTTLANAIAGTKIATSSAGSGTHTAVACPFGLGDGTTTFNTPDLRGRVPAGADAMFGASAATRLTLADVLGAYGTLGANGGEQRHTMTLGELVAHTHTTTLAANSTAGGTANYFAGNNTGSNAAASSSTGSTTPFNNIQPTLVVNYIIKT